MDNWQQQMEAERYQEDLAAITECIARGVSDRAVLQLASECGIDSRDIKPLIQGAQYALEG